MEEGGGCDSEDILTKIPSLFCNIQTELNINMLVCLNTLAIWTTCTIFLKYLYWGQNWDLVMFNLFLYYINIRIFKKITRKANVQGEWSCVTRRPSLIRWRFLQELGRGLSRELEPVTLGHFLLVAKEKFRSLTDLILSCPSEVKFRSLTDLIPLWSCSFCIQNEAILSFVQIATN